MRLAVLDQLSAAPDSGPPLLVVATDRYIGEGFDCPRMDTLFPAFPVSSEGPMTQYVGRILREHPAKPDVEVHDYADTKVPMLARMHGKRLTTYRRLGFSAAPVASPPATLDTVIASDLPAARDNARGQAGPVEVMAPSAPSGRRIAAGPTASQVRAWARSAGMEVPARGRLGFEIWSAYQRAHDGG